MRTQRAPLVAGAVWVIVLLGVPRTAGAQSALADSAARIAALADSAYQLRTPEGVLRAITLLVHASELYRRIPDRAAEASTLFVIGRLHGFMVGGSDSALMYYHRSMVIERELGNRAREGRLLGEIASGYAGRGRPDSALAYYLQELVVQRVTGNRAAEGTALSDVATVYADIGRPDSALVYYRQALLIDREVGDRALEGTILGNIGSVYDDLRRPDSALAYYRLALVVQREVGDTAGEGTTLNNIGLVYQYLGRPDSALGYFRHGLVIHRAVGNRAMEGTTLNNMGRVYIDLRRSDSALGYYRQALEIQRELGHQAGEGTALNNIGAVYRNLGRPDSALAYYRQALLFDREAGNRASEGATLGNIGVVYAGMELPDSALASYSQALAIHREVGNREGESAMLGSIGFLYSSAALVDPARAVAYYDSAATVTASIRQQAGDEANRLSYAERRVDLSLHNVWVFAWLARAGELGAARSAGAALAAAERGRAQGLLDLMRRSANDVGGAAGVTNALTRPGADLAAEADSLLAPLRRAHTAALSYLVTRDTLITWFLLPSGALHATRTPIARDSLVRLVRVLRSGLGADSARGGMAHGAEGEGREQEAVRSGGLASSGVVRPNAAAAATLGRLLIPAAVVARVAAGSELVIVPHGVLGLVPFAALPLKAGIGLLGARYAVRYAPSLAALNAAEIQPPRLAGGPARAAALRQALVVGNPEMPLVPDRDGNSVRLRPLPGAGEEARAIAKRLDAPVLSGSAASEGEVRDRLPVAPLVHLATHGLAFGSEARVRFSYVALAPDSTHDGLFTLGELLDDPTLTLTAELVVLSACQTGLGDLRQAEGTVGLQRAFLAKGARSVLVSLWSVDDRATRLLMDRFYAHWLDDPDQPSKAEALRRAQADVRGTKGFEHPRYWAAFQLVGAR